VTEGIMIRDPQEMAFINTIRAAPDDDSPRQVYADWLEEQGDSRAEFLRVHLAIANDRFNESLWNRYRDLIVFHAQQWLEPFFHYNYIRWEFDRGIPGRAIVGGTRRLLEDFAELMAGSPLYQLVITDTQITTRTVRLLIDHVEMQQVSALAFDSTLDMESAQALASSPNLRSIRRLWWRRPTRPRNVDDVLIARFGYPGRFWPT
jgi:uncharacterized protein (TIGR02996 family)